jgi:AcrR family transcriptional regulator
MTGDEIRRRMLAHGAALIDASGLAVSFDALRMDDLIRDAGVSRSSVYRLWPTRDAYLGDLLAEIGRRTGADLAHRDAFALVARTLRAKPEVLATAETRIAALYEAMRVAIRDTFYGTVSSTAWRTSIALAVTAPSIDDEATAHALLDALAERQRILSDRLVGYYRAAIPAFGFRLRPQFGDDWSTFAVLVNATIQGLSILRPHSPELTDAERLLSPAADIPAAAWSLSALSFAALFQFFFEADPGFDPVRTAALLTDVETRLAERGEGASPDA